MIRLSLAAACLCAALSSACFSTSPSSRFVALEPLEAPASGLDVAGPAVEVAVVEFPASLDRPQVVTRAAPHGRRYAEFERWAEPLETSFARTLAADLRVLLDSQRVVAAPDRLGLLPELSLRLAVDRFDATEEQGAVLEARWRWTLDGTQAGLGACRLVEPVDGAALDDRIDGLNRALHALAARLAEEHGRLL